jgi:predicted  nucleic acid-binding Zn-ribbon protein
MTKNNITTIEGLAQLIHETMASKEDIKDVREDIATVNGRLDRIEHLLIEEQKRKIENLEQIPPDLVVKFQTIDIVELFEPSSGDETRLTVV